MIYSDDYNQGQDKTNCVIFRKAINIAYLVIVKIEILQVNQILIRK